MFEKRNSHMYCPCCDSEVTATISTQYNDDNPNEPVLTYLEIDCQACDYYEFSDITSD
jgi:C4-type Zn-finger protein